MNDAERIVLVDDLKSILKENITRNRSGRDPAILLSSGVDSNSVLYLLMEMGIKPIVYSFKMSDSDGSQDFDYAKETAASHRLEFGTINLPKQSPAALLQDLQLLAKEYNCRTKTDFECFWTLYYAFNSVLEEDIFMGLGADGHFGMSKNATMQFRDNLPGFDAFRYDLYSNDKHGKKKQCDIYARKHGKNIIQPYRDLEVCKLFLGKSWRDLNQPKQKWPLHEICKPHKQGKIPHHQNFQLGDSGIADHFKVLLTLPEFHDCKTVVGVYNRIAKNAGDTV